MAARKWRPKVNALESPLYLLLVTDAAITISGTSVSLRYSDIEEGTPVNLESVYEMGLN